MEIISKYCYARKNRVKYINAAGAKEKTFKTATRQKKTRY